MTIKEASFEHILFQKGIDLFNEEKFFEAHEAWELLWHKLENPEKTFVQGLIQSAAHFVHLSKRNYSGAISLAQSAKTKLYAQNACKEIFTAIDIEPLLSALEYNVSMVKEKQRIDEKEIANILKQLIDHEDSSLINLTVLFENETKAESSLDSFLLPKLF